MHILVINPLLLRLKALGACEQDRLTNVKDLERLGHTVKLLTTSSRKRPVAEYQTFFQQADMDVQLIPDGRKPLHPARLRDLAFLDGASWEYAAPYFHRAVAEALEAWPPDVVWCHASYLWPAAAQAHRRGIPTVVRSVNYEAIHMIQEDGWKPANVLRFVGKTLGERRALRAASVLAAITPDEHAIYQKIAPDADIVTLPLRTLPRLLRPPQRVIDRQPLHVFMMGASYNVAHNRAGLEFIVTEVVPRVRQVAPGTFVFHVLGSKIPEDLSRAHAAPDLIFDGFVDDLNAHLAGMDIAVSPSRFGQGMQQKVFEPLCRGFPTVTHRRALAGYPFQDGDEVMLADDADGFAAQLQRLCDPALRAKLAQRVSDKAHALFSQSVLDERVSEILERATRKDRARPVANVEANA